MKLPQKAIGSSTDGKRDFLGTMVPSMIMLGCGGPPTTFLVAFESTPLLLLGGDPTTGIIDRMSILVRSLDGGQASCTGDGIQMTFNTSCSI
jgi:hypothetical protein